MLAELAKQYTAQVQTFYYLILLINMILHLIFAGGVAKDAGALQKNGQRTVLVSPATWAFATLVGGVFCAAVYWFMHHVKLSTPYIRAN